MHGKVSSGCPVIDSLLNGGYDSDIITTIYGPAGSGKTNLCLFCAREVIKKGKKVIYVDTEGGFSVDRLQQIDPTYKDLLKNMIFLRPTKFSEQKRAFTKLKSLVETKKVGLIIIDSIAMLYRLELGKSDEVYEVNRELGKQIASLTEITRKEKIPVLITNQVYSNFDQRDQVNMVGGDLLKYGSKCLIELQITPDNKRRALIKKHRSLPEGKEITFEITQTALLSAPSKRGFRLF